MTEYLRLDDILDIIDDQVTVLISETRQFSRENPDIDIYMDYFQELIAYVYEPYVSIWIDAFLENIDLNQMMVQKWENLQKKLIVLIILKMSTPKSALTLKEKKHDILLFAGKREWQKMISVMERSTTRD